MTSYGKRRRRAVDEVMEEVPLQLEIIVRTPDSKSESPPKHQISENGNVPTSIGLSINVL